MNFTTQLLASVAQAQQSDVAPFVGPLNNALKQFNIENPVEIAALIATFSLESQRFTHLKEDLYYKDPARLAEIFKRQFDLNKDGVITPDEVDRAKPFTRNPAALEMKLYGGFQGRGLGQITWQKNYEICGELCGQNFVSNPTLLEDPMWGTAASVAFWVHCNMSSKAADPEATRRAWNGPKMVGLTEYKALFAHAKSVLGA